MEQDDTDFVRQIDDKIAARVAKQAAEKAELLAEQNAINRPRDFLIEVVEHMPKNLTEFIITGTETETLAEAQAEDKRLYLVAKAKSPIPEFIGCFGLKRTAIKYQHRHETMKVTRNKDNVTGLIFDKSGAVDVGKSDGAKSTISSIPWTLSCQLTLSVLGRMAWFLQATEDGFQFEVHDRKLYLTVKLTKLTRLHAIMNTQNKELEEQAKAAGKTSWEYTNERISGIFPNRFFVADSDISLSNSWYFVNEDLIQISKNAEWGDRMFTLKVIDRGVVGLSFEHNHATYDFYMRGSG